MIDLALRALSDPTRRSILRLVRDEELPAGAIAARFPITRPAVSQHLALLRAAGLIAERRVGAQRRYRARPAGLSELRTWLNDFAMDPFASAVAAASMDREAGDRS